MDNIMIEAIRAKKKVSVTFNSFEKGSITRICVPFDIAPSKRSKDQTPKFQFYDLDSPDGQHNLALFQSQIHTIAILDQIFNPGDYITWSPMNWTIARDWGTYS